MTLPSSPNPIKATQIQTEFGGANPIGLSEYYGSTGGTRSASVGGGIIKYSDFYGRTSRRDQLVTLTGTGYYTVPGWVTKMTIVIIAGGGGGGSAYWRGQNDGGGGGGAGGVIYLEDQTGYATGSYYYSTGAGGGATGGQGGSQGYNGSNSNWAGYVAIGGGGGGGRPGLGGSNYIAGYGEYKGSTYPIYAHPIIDGMPGGSGGGGNAFYGDGVGGAGTAGQGSAGGSGNGRPYGSQGDGFNGGGGGKFGAGYNNWYGLAYPGQPPLRITGGIGAIYSWYSYSLGIFVGPGGVAGGGGAGSGFGGFELNPDHGVYAYPGYGGGNGAGMYVSPGGAGDAQKGGGGGGGSGILDWGSYSGNGGSGAIYLWMKNY